MRPICCLLLGLCLENVLMTSFRGGHMAWPLGYKTFFILNSAELKIVGIS